MKKNFTFKNKNTTKGFTLVETLIAILILAIAVDAVMSLASQGFFSIRYAKNQMVATALAQEGIEYVRNRRDTISQQGGTWDTWRTEFNVDNVGNTTPLVSNPVDNTTSGTLQGCWLANKGCLVSPMTTIKSQQCTSPAACQAITYYPNAFATGQGFYGYIGMGNYPNNVIKNTGSFATSFVRSVVITSGAKVQQATVSVTVKWLDGNQSKSLTQSILLTDWK